MAIKCEYDYCIFNKNCSDCMLKEIRINCIGMCDNCVTVQLPEDKLEEYKQNHIQEIKSICKLDFIPQSPRDKPGSAP